MELGLGGKTALVTAGSRGFGKAVACELASEGANVAICARGQEDLDLALAEIQEAGQNAPSGANVQTLAQVVDVTNGEAVRGFFQKTEKEMGPIDLLLVNAGGPPAGRFLDMELSQWQDAYKLTIESALRLCQLALPGMIERKWGRIVQITSVSVLQPVENLALSSVLRPAVQALTKNLSLEGAPYGVTVNSVAPGYHQTSAVERLITAKIKQSGCKREDVLADWAREIPMGRLGKPEELAGLILFLMSERAGYITGQCLVSDGGWVKGIF